MIGYGRPMLNIPDSLRESSSDWAELMPWVPLPSKTVPIPVTYHLTTIICDERMIAKLLETLLARAGLSINEAARRLKCNASTISQYVNGRRTRPSLLWFLKIVALCGAKVSLEFPSDKRS